jgi:hypothetical protein
MRKNPEWEAMKVKTTTPSDITAFIIHKCGEKAKGCEGKKVLVSFSGYLPLTCLASMRLQCLLVQL